MKTHPGNYFALMLTALAVNLSFIQPTQAAGWVTNSPLATPRNNHTATLLPDGKVLVVGGYNNAVAILDSVELYDPAIGTWSAAGSFVTGRREHTATLLADGRVLFACGFGPGPVVTTSMNSVESYDPANGTWTATGSMAAAQAYHKAVLLPNKQVLVAGGGGAELYNESDGTWVAVNPPANAIYQYTATLLPGGKVLIAGGLDNNGVTADAEVYDPIAGTWETADSMKNARRFHTATLLPNGKVLVTGGYDDNLHLNIPNAELFDPITGKWQTTGTMTTNRASHTATLLPDGKVLVVGGVGINSDLSNTELYNPATGTWTTTGVLTTGRSLHTATLLPNGKVLVAGGEGNIPPFYLSSAELYDPATEKWTNINAMNNTRSGHTATLLSNGKVLVSGGNTGYTFDLSSAELYDPATGKWKITGSLNVARSRHTATLLSNGRLLVAGGSYGSTVSSAELYDVGLGYTNAWQPQIATVASPLNLGNSLVITGSLFRGISGAASGNSQDSSTDYPLVQLRRLDNEQTVFLLTTNWSTNSFTSLPVWNFPPGYALATVFVNGIQSTSSIVNISIPVPITPTLTSPQTLTNGFQFAFTNSVGALFGVLTTTNPALPLTNWTALGGVIESSPGQFQFTDLQATNGPKRFYRAYAP